MGRAVSAAFFFARRAHRVGPPTESTSSRTRFQLETVRETGSDSAGWIRSHGPGGAKCRFAVMNGVQKGRETSKYVINIRREDGTSLADLARSGASALWKIVRQSFRRSR
jgi:hypothetical protein